MPESQKKSKTNDLADFLQELDEKTRVLLVKCLHLNGEGGDELSDRKKLERLRASL